MTMPINALFPDDKSQIHSLCLGSGRFLRSVLVPALIAAGATINDGNGLANNGNGNGNGNGNNFNPVILQTRGRTFMDYCHHRRSESRKKAKAAAETTTEAGECSDFLNYSYEVDTVQHDGRTITDIIPCFGAGSFGTVDSKACIMDELLPHLQILRLIGVGVTEAGLSSCHTKAMTDLYDVLNKLRELQGEGEGQRQDGSGSGWICDNPNGKICVVNTDNVPLNGTKLKEFMLQLAAENVNDNDNMTMTQFLTNKVTFHNTMVDRITSQRPGSNGLVPRAEPTPLKALVIEDLEGDLPPSLVMQKDEGLGLGVVVRKKAGQLDADIALKLRVANGTHTAIAHVMALCGLLMTDALSNPKGEGGDCDNHDGDDKISAKLMYYLDSLFQHQILKAAENLDDTTTTATTSDVQAVYDDWRRRLIHAHFGLSTFFITQNGAAKGGIRIGPTIVDLVKHGEDVNCSTIFALAAILRFLTPAVPVPVSLPGVPGSGSGTGGIYRGWLDKTKLTRSRNGADNEDSDRTSGKTVEYADGLSYNIQQGWYEFRCACNVVVPNISQKESHPLPVLLGSFPTAMQSCAYEDSVRAYLLKSDGGDLSCLATDPDPSIKEKLDLIVRAVATVYARMVARDGMLELLKELPLSSSCETLLDGINK